MTRQKLPKVLAILGGCLLGGGIVLAGAGFVAMDCSLDAYTGGKEAPQPLTASYSQGAVTAVKVDASVGDVTVVGAEAGGDLEVLYSTSYACQEEGGVLTLTEQEGAGGWKWYRIWNSWEGREDSVTIQVPWDMLLSYDLTTGVGSRESRTRPLSRPEACGPHLRREAIPPGIVRPRPLYVMTRQAPHCVSLPHSVLTPERRWIRRLRFCGLWKPSGSSPCG